MSELVLEIKNLSLSFDTQGASASILKNVELHIGPGEIVGLVGESGSGKSLTALAVIGLLSSQLKASGSVLLGDLNPQEILGAPERMLNTIRGKVASIIFQEPLTALDPLMKIGRQLAEPLRRHQGISGDALESAIIEALTEVRITNPARIAQSFPHQISGGERQRAAIAMALACQPSLLIADEPTTALDVTVQSEVLALLDSIVSERNMALLFISHDLAVVGQITDTVVVLKDGVVVESGSLQEIMANPKHPYTQDLVKNARVLDDALDIAKDGK